MNPEFMVACGFCEGEGGGYSFDSPHDKWGDPTPGGEWVECPFCHGSGWACADDPPPEIEQDELPPPRCGGSGEDDGR